MKTFPTSHASETGAGPIPHKTLRIAGLVFRAPVKLLPSHSRGCLPYPQRNGIGYTYALPGGAQVSI